MIKKRINPTLSAIGERGFLSRLLPKIKAFQPNRFLIPPGDDAAVLNGNPRSVLSIDGLTNQTHFRLMWSKRCERLGGFTLARGLGWKLLGSSLSDLAAMGHTKNRWAMVYLGAPKKMDMNFLSDFYRGLQDSAVKYSCALAGGDTVRAEDLTLVSAVGGSAVGNVLTRSGAKPGDLIGICGMVGDASQGLLVLDKKKNFGKRDDAYFVKRFFSHEPCFEEGQALSQTKGVTSLIDLSDSLHETLRLVCADSNVGARLEINNIPVSETFRRVVGISKDVLGGGEDYGLLFTFQKSALPNLRKRLDFQVVGTIENERAGLGFTESGVPFRPGKFFIQF